MMIKNILSAALCTAFPFGVLAEDASQFVEANLLGIFYHELGHALVALEEVPIFGQEEDAADVFSIYLIDALYDEETAKSIAFDASAGFWAEAEMRSTETADILWWDVHGPDEQRFFNTVCLFYGADPENRGDIAEDLGLPEDRAEYCPSEYDQANNSWGVILDGLVERGAGQTLVFEDGTGENAEIVNAIISREVEALNAELSLASDLRIRVDECGEANAYFDPENTEVVMCAEFVQHLQKLESSLE